MNGTGQGADGRSERTTCERTPRETRIIARHAGVVEPTHAGAEHLGLVDGLWCRYVAQLGRSVCRAHDDRHTTLVGLHQWCDEVCGRGAGCAQEHCRHAGGTPDSECREPCAPLVVEDVQRQLRAARYCHRQRSGPAAGRHHRMRDALTDPFVHEGGAESSRGVAGGGHGF